MHLACSKHIVASQEVVAIIVVVVIGTSFGKSSSSTCEGRPFLCAPRTCSVTSGVAFIMQCGNFPLGCFNPLQSP